MNYLAVLLHLACVTIVMSKTFSFVINPSNKLIYASQLNVSEYEITGSGFKEGMTIVVTHYLSIVVENSTLIRVIRQGNHWTSGVHHVTSVTMDGQQYSINPWIAVAEIIDDVNIKPSAATYHPSKSKSIVIATTVSYYGIHFNGTTMASAQLDIVPSDAFQFEANTEINIPYRTVNFKIRLKHGKSWLPDDFIFPNNSFSVPVRVLSMNIGAGLIEFVDPVIIGYITKDVDSFGNFFCNDSCPYAFDGFCGDVSKPLYHSYNPQSQYYSYYIPPCNVDTDCTDCGGLDTVILYQNNTPITIDAPEVMSTIYSRTPNVLVNGSGFVEGMKVELVDNILSFDESVKLFDTIFINSKQIQLIAKQTSFWGSNNFISVKSIIIGKRSYYPNGESGLNIYRIIPTPTISEYDLQIHDTQSIIFIHSTGINDNPEENKIKLSPTLDEAFEVIATKKKNDNIYDVEFKGLTLKLKNGYSWSGSTYMTNSKPIELKIVSIDTGAGIVPSEKSKSWDFNQIFPKRIGYIYKDNLDNICDNSCEFALSTSCNDRTAYKYNEFTDDGKICAPKTDCQDCGGYAALLPVESSVSVYFYGSIKLEQYQFQKPVPTYQSIISSVIAIEINGWSFFDSNTMSFNFDPPLNKKDFDLVADHARSQLFLELKPKKKWPIGKLKIISINDVNGKIILPNYADKVFVVAIILDDPVVHSASTKYYNTQSKVITIKGGGFTGDTQIELSPTKVGTYKAISYNEHSISLLLHPTASWSTTEITNKMDLKVVGVSSTAGKITFDKPVTVGYIVSDKQDLTCDDTCKYANDGLCAETNRCATGTDCTDCSIALALLEADADNDGRSVPKSSHYSIWFIVSIVIAVLVVITLLLFVYYSYGRSIIGLEPGNAIEMVKYVAVPQVESDCTYI